MKRKTIVKLLILWSIVPISIVITLIFGDTVLKSALHIASGVVIGGIFLEYDSRT